MQPCPRVRGALAPVLARELCRARDRGGAGPALGHESRQRIRPRDRHPGRRPEFLRSGRPHHPLRSRSHGRPTRRRRRDRPPRRRDLADAIRRQEREARKAAAAAKAAAAQPAPGEAAPAPVEPPAAPAPVAQVEAPAPAAEAPAAPLPVEIAPAPAAPVETPAPVAPVSAPAVEGPAAPVALAPPKAPADAPAKAAAPRQGTRSGQMVPHYASGRTIAPGAPTGTATSAAGREVEAASRAAGLSRLRERAESTVAAQAAPKRRQPKGRPDAEARTDARAAAAIRTARTGDPEIASPLARVRAAAAEINAASRVLADVAPDIRIRRIAHLATSRKHAANAHTRTGEALIAQNFRAAIAASPASLAALDRLKQGIADLARSAGDLASSTKRHGGLTPRQTAGLGRVREAAHGAADWLPEREDGSLPGLDVRGVLDPRRFTKRAADGSTYRLPALPAGWAETTAAEMAQRAAGDRWRASQDAGRTARQVAPQAPAASRAPDRREGR